jgi:hypothetical protein
MNTAPELLKRLYQRQLNMIAIGGVIGAELFIGSSVVLKYYRSWSVPHLRHHRGPDHPDDADARRDGDRQPVEEIIR